MHIARIIGTDAGENEQGTENDNIFDGKGDYDGFYTSGGDDIVLVTPGNGVDHVEDLDPFHAPVASTLNRKPESGPPQAKMSPI
jgi:hypothetical protein